MRCVNYKDTLHFYMNYEYKNSVVTDQIGVIKKQADDSLLVFYVNKVLSVKMISN